MIVEKIECSSMARGVTPALDRAEKNPPRNRLSKYFTSIGAFLFWVVDKTQKNDVEQLDIIKGMIVA